MLLYSASFLFYFLTLQYCIGFAIHQHESTTGIHVQLHFYMETVTDFIFLGSKITVDGEYSHEIKRHLLLGRKAMKNLDSILKSRDKVNIVQAMVFPVIMYGCESWTIKEAECWRIYVLNCDAGEDSWESLGQQGDQTRPS